METYIETMKFLGYNEEQALYIRNSFVIVKMKEKTILKNILRNYSYLIRKGYTKNDIIKMTIKIPALYSYDTNIFEEKLNYFHKLGYSEKEIINITKLSPPAFGLNIVNIDEKIKELYKLGYSYEEILKIIRRSPVILNLKIEKINNKIGMII